MCTTVFVRGTKDYIDSFGQLKAMVGAENVVWHDSCGYPNDPDDSCLCPIDLLATFKRAGYEIDTGYDKPNGFTDYEAWLPA